MRFPVQHGDRECLGCTSTSCTHRGMFYKSGCSHESYQTHEELQTRMKELIQQQKGFKSYSDPQKGEYWLETI